MCTTLGVTTIFDTKQLVGYLSLLQCCIYEHFPTICDMKVHHSLVGSPRPRRWRIRQSHPRGFSEYMRRLDALTVDDVIWTPYTDHRVHREFDDSSLYLSYMRWETMVTNTCLRGVYKNMAMFKASHDQF
ncbi:unnamed protein product [Lathyrus oleraceus]